MNDRIVVLVARPTPSGIDERAMHALRDAVAARVPGPVQVAYLDQEEPSLHDVLDQAVATGVRTATVLPTALPADRYLTTWISRAAANWAETRPDATLDLRLATSLEGVPALAGVVAELAAEPGTPITASPAAFRSPSWSTLSIPDRHLLVCRGPRCTVYGSGPTQRALAEATRGTGTQVTSVGCLGPCNLGPLVIDNPAGTWHQHIDTDAVPAVVTAEAGVVVDGAAMPAAAG
ncbi:MAG: hypothetical protein ABS81_15800 [Pseudonocardia sp. SCN 72-86]|nr:MAG: hypothetical protein ABS81_15800 [Pseudonocardia sp. SCN 72-86]